MRSFLPSVALVTAAFLLGCQDSGPVGPDTEIGGPNFENQRNPKPHGGDTGGGNLFDSPSFTCAGGAVTNTGATFGNVSWAGKVFVGAAANGDDHVHYKVHLRNVTVGTYTIFASQAEDPNCDGTAAGGIPTGAIDIGTVTVNNKGQGRVRGQFNFPRHDAGGLTTNVWVTVVVPGKVLRSPAVTMVLKPHVEV